MFLQAWRKDIARAMAVSQIFAQTGLIRYIDGTWAANLLLH